MATKNGAVECAKRRSAEDDRRVRAEIGRARRGAGLSHDAVGAACGISGSAAWRIEHGVTKAVDPKTLGGVERVLVVIADTRRNRRAVASAPLLFAGSSRDTRRTFRALAAGRDPGSAIILL